jgi:dihydropteroate synthase
LINTENELKLISDYIIEISNNFRNIHLSIDTYNSAVAEFALEKGFSIINDISSGKYDPNMYDVIKDYNSGYVMMHMLGDPDNMQDNPEYDDVVETIISFFKGKVNELESSGIQNIILDPGFGFGKTIQDNFKILKDLSLFQALNKPLLVGLSRKSMIYKFLNISPAEALNGTTALNTLAIDKGADILRVHDAKEASECIKLIENLN